MARVRGAMFHQVMRLPPFAPGMPSRDRLFATLSPAARAVLGGTLLPTSWYDEAVAAELCRGVHVALELRGDGARHWWRRQHIQGLQGLLRAMLDRVEPSRVADALGALWSRQHDTGTMRVAVLGERSAEVHLAGNENTATPDYQLALCGALEGMFRIGGAVDAEARSRAVARDHVRFDLTWSAVDPGGAP